MSFVDDIRQLLTSDPQVSDLVEKKSLSEFSFIGIKETACSLDVFAFVQSDELTEGEVSEICDKFFNITQACHTFFNLKQPFLPDSLQFNNDWRVPNGILCFVFEGKCPRSLSTFIRTQMRISHFRQAALMVAWTVDVKNKRVYTHKNPVSIFPPVVIREQGAFPNPNYLESFLSSYRTQEAQESSEQNNRSRDDRKAIEIFQNIERKLENLKKSIDEFSKKEYSNYFMDVTISQFITEQSISITADTYNAEQVGAMGKHARSDNNTFIKSSQKQDVAEVAVEIQQLLEQIENMNPIATEIEKIDYVSNETTPSFKRRAISALEPDSEAAIERFLDDPYINVAKTIIKRWMQS